MPRRIKPDTTSPHPQPPGKSDSRLPLPVAVEGVVAAWEAADEHTEQTRTRMTETVLRFAAYSAAVEVPTLAAVTPAQARSFITAPTRQGSSPELATQHARRTALRTLFRTARRLGIAAGDPTLDVRLEPRGSLTARPLTDDEVTLCRASARAVRGPAASVRATAWALGEATAVSSEITAVRVRDLDDPDRPLHVRLPGTRRHDPLTVELTTWGATILRSRAETLRTHHGDDVLLAYGGQAPPGEAKAQASVCNALREVLASAGLLAEADVRPASLRHWAGRRAYDASAPIEAVARLLGMRSLDATADDIALNWRPSPRTTGRTD